MSLLTLTKKQFARRLKAARQAALLIAEGNNLPLIAITGNGSAVSADHEGLHAWSVSVVTVTGEEKEAERLLGRTLYHHLRPGDPDPVNIRYVHPAA